MNGCLTEEEYKNIQIGDEFEILYDGWGYGWEPGTVFVVFEFHPTERTPRIRSLSSNSIGALAKTTATEVDPHSHKPYIRRIVRNDIVLIEIDSGGRLTTCSIPAKDFDPKKHKKFTF